MSYRRSHPFLSGLGIFLAVVLAVGAVSGFLLYRSAKQARAELEVLKEEVDALGDTLASGDVDTIQAAVARVDNSAHAIHRELASPLWAVAGHLPVVGSDVRVARTLADVLVDLDDNVLVPLGKDAIYLTPDGYLTDEGFSLDGLERIVALMQEAQPVVERSRATIEALPEPSRQELRDAVSTALEALSTAEEFLGLINSLTSAVG